MASSQISGFYRLGRAERLNMVREFASLGEDEMEAFGSDAALQFEVADRMIENVICTMQLPLGIATNFLINGKECLVPMAIEEPSVVAAASNAAKLARESGGFKAECTAPVMIGQVQVVGIKDVGKAAKDMMKNKNKILELANVQDPVLVKFGGGARDLEARVLETKAGKMLVIHLLVDVRDAMGANAVNTMAEAIAPEVERISGGRARLRIISNLATRRVAKAEAVWKKDSIGGEGVVDGIIEAYEFANADCYRCATHNKGIMNGVDAVVIATGNDFRAVEAGAHAYAALDGRYKPLTRYSKTKNGDLKGILEMPLALGLVGGATKTHPVARAAVKLLGVKTANELACVVASVGLAQNFAALKALATEGIQRGHMKLHSRNIAILAGAEGDEIGGVAEKMVAEGKVRADRAKEILDSIRGQKGN